MLVLQNYYIKENLSNRPNINNREKKWLNPPFKSTNLEDKIQENG